MIISIGDKIRELRINRGVYQKDICCETLNRTVLSKIENSKMLPSIPQLQYISNFFNVPINYFFETPSMLGDTVNNSDMDKLNLGCLFKQERHLDILELYESNKLRKLADDNFYFFIGISYYNTGLFSNSLITLRKYIQSYKKFDGNKKNQYVENYAVALNKLQCIMLRNSNYNKAIKYLYAAKNELIKYEKTTTRIYVAIINNIGAVCCKSRQFTGAIKELEGYLESTDGAVVISILPYVHLSMNLAYYNTQNYPQALKHIEKAICLFKYMGQSFDAGECYLNYINCLRFQSKFSEALDLIKGLQKQYYTDSILLNLFIIQEMIVLFNMARYYDVHILSKQISFRSLRKRGKMEYYFMLGHVNYINGNKLTANNYYVRCEKFFCTRKFNYDLSLIYQDLASITGDTEYINKSKAAKESEGVFNILINTQ